VELAAVLITAACMVSYPARPSDYAGLLWIATCSAIGVETSRKVERLRERHRAEPYKVLDGIWLMPAVLLFPPGFGCLLVIATYVWVWLRVTHSAPHRWTFTTASIVIGAEAGAVTYRLLTGSSAGYGRLPSQPVMAAAGIGAAAVVMLLNLALIGAVICLTNRDASIRDIFGGWSAQGTEATALSFGILVATAYTVTPWLTILAVPVQVLLQRTLLFAHFQAAARTDSKTGLANATWWHDLAEREVERAVRLGEEVGVLIADLDHFKRVNDTYGHLAGDAVLREVAKALTSEVREYDIVGRFGGEEFALILPSTSPARALDVAERLRERVSSLTVEAPGHIDGRTRRIGRLSVSIGLAVLPDQAEDLLELLRLADAALYAAKAAGRNRVCISPHAGGPPADALLPPA
jgi:diguanylate cyclase (GGDEF)-like protein